MILYFDTSAIVPLLVLEPASENSRRLWDLGDAVLSTRLAFVETAAALAQAARLGRLSGSAHREAVARLDELWEEVNVLELDRHLMERAAELARVHALRGYDAVHAAAAESLVDRDVVAVSGDRALLSAWAELGLSTSDTTPR